MSSLRILAEITFPSVTMRLWDGSGGVFVDADGYFYRPVVLMDDALSSIEASINAEAFSLGLVLSGIDEQTAKATWDDFLNGTIIGSKVRIMIQRCDEFDQPVGTPKVRFTGTVADLDFIDQATDRGISSTIKVEIANRFTLRTVTNGGVLSDVDQRQRGRRKNPSLPDDRFCERVPLMRDKTTRWPHF